MSNTPKVTGSPAVIWLVYGDLEHDDKHSNFQEVTWCEDSQYDSDVKYVRADEVERLREANDNLMGEINALERNQ